MSRLLGLKQSLAAWCFQSPFICLSPLQHPFKHHIRDNTWQSCAFHDCYVWPLCLCRIKHLKLWFAYSLIPACYFDTANKHFCGLKLQRKLQKTALWIFMLLFSCVWKLHLKLSCLFNPLFVHLTNVTVHHMWWKKQTQICKTDLNGLRLLSHLNLFLIRFKQTLVCLPLGLCLLRLVWKTKQLDQDHLKRGTLRSWV